MAVVGTRRELLELFGPGSSRIAQLSMAGMSHWESFFCSTYPCILIGQPTYVSHDVIMSLLECILGSLTMEPL